MKFFKKVFLFTLLLGTSINSLHAAQEVVADVPMSLMSKIMLGGAVISATATGMRYWWVSKNNDGIEHGFELATQRKWVHNFKLKPNLQENAQELIQHLAQDRNGLKALVSATESKCLPKSIEELIKILEKHEEQLNAHVRQIEKVVGDAELSAEGKTLAQRKERVRILLLEENAEHQEWMPWLKNWARTWVEKPNKKRALDCLQKMYSSVADTENLLQGVKQERQRMYKEYSAYRKTVTLLSKITEQQVTVSSLTVHEIQTVKSIWCLDLDEILSELQILNRRIILIKQKIDPTSTAKLADVAPSVRNSVTDLLITIQNSIIEKEMGLSAQTSQASARPSREESKRPEAEEHSI